ncbi:MAG: restriction endonuclease, partial [Planctomycetes bacterium]|nr:restriction endonuclease [Planctomycetota bacterium]
FAACTPLIAVRFPDNRHPRAKVRQQLQRLRALGVVEFLGAARYRRTFQT